VSQHLTVRNGTVCFSVGLRSQLVDQESTWSESICPARQPGERRLCWCLRGPTGIPTATLLRIADLINSTLNPLYQLSFRCFMACHRRE
jgi:hypothetical protein